MTVTHISAATASLVWMLIEWFKHGKPTLVGTATGCIAGLATITPASGFVGPLGALLIGILAAIFCYYMVGFVKNKMKRTGIAGIFAASLELTKEGIIKVSQSKIFENLMIKKA